jgi:hypothetical protein
MVHLPKKGSCATGTSVVRKPDSVGANIKRKQQSVSESLAQSDSEQKIQKWKIDFLKFLHTFDKNFLYGY